MRFLSVNVPVQARIFGQSYNLKPLEAQKENIEDILVTDNVSAAELLKRHPDFLLNVVFNTCHMPGFPISISGLDGMGVRGNCLIMRNGGIGDHIQLLPFLETLRRKLSPDMSLWLAAQQEKHAIYETNENIDRLLPLPLPLDVVLEADYLIDFSAHDDWCHLDQETMTDGYFRFLGIDANEVGNKKPNIAWSSGRSKAVYHLFKRLRKKVPRKATILLNWTASNPLRMVPPLKLLSLVQEFQDIQFIVAQPRGYAVETSKIIAGYDGICDFTEHMGFLVDYVELIYHCDAVVSTDTGTGHLAEALGKPSLILFGPTKDKVWNRYYTETIPLRAEYSGTTCQSPCGLIKVEDACPEAVQMKTSFSPCLLSISQKRVRDGFVRLLQKVPKR